MYIGCYTLETGCTLTPYLGCRYSPVRIDTRYKAVVLCSLIH